MACKHEGGTDKCARTARGQCKAYVKQYRQDNRLQWNAYKKAWCLTPEGRAKKLALAAYHNYKEKKQCWYRYSAADISLIAEVLRAGQCKVSGLPFNFHGGRTYDSPSLDHINPKGSNCWSNTRIVLDIVNVGMNAYGKETALFVWGHAIAKQSLEDGNADLAAAILGYITKYKPQELVQGTDVLETQD